MFECIVASADVSSEDDDIHSSLQGVFIPGSSVSVATRAEPAIAEPGLAEPFS